MTSSKKTKPSTSSVGETLVSQYADRLAVRQARDEIDKRGQQHVGGGVFVEAPLIADELRKRGESGGRQTSPELAKLASGYLQIPYDHFLDMTPSEAELAASDVRRLAASVLSQAHDD